MGTPGTLYLVVVACVLLIAVVLLALNIAFILRAQNVAVKVARKYARLQIITSHWNENLTWLQASKYPVTVISKENAPGSTAPFEAESVVPNSGNEASAYLKYIVDHYDDLPPYVAFVHGHDKAWHMKNGGILQQLDRLNLDGVTFHTLNNCFTQVWKAGDESYDALQTYWPREFERWLGPLPTQLCHDCCAQFVVSRDTIRKQPLAAYQSWLDFSLDPSVRKVGFMFEYTWHYIFGEPACVPASAWTVNTCLKA